MAKKYRGHCDLDTVPTAFQHIGKARRLPRIEALRAAGCNIPLGENVEGLADWEAHLLYG